MIFSETDTDVLVEVLNIGMGAAAEKMSAIIDKKVSVSKPAVELAEIGEIDFSYLEPFVCVMSKYTEGIDGSELLLFREADIKLVLNYLRSNNPNASAEMDNMSLNSLSEIINQAMGSATDAISSFLGITVNVSEPEVIAATKQDIIRRLLSVSSNSQAIAKFMFSIDGVVKGEFISTMEQKTAKEIVNISLGEMEQTSKRQAPFVSGHNQKKHVRAVSYTYKQLEPVEHDKSSGNDSNLELIMSVPVQITVELGRTRKKIKDIAEFAVGNIVELDRQAGDQVDIVANGRLIARGDVVVVDDNYSVRITEIMKARDNLYDL